MIVKSEESHWLYVAGVFIWLVFVAFILTGLFTTIKDAPFVAVPFFGVFLFMAWMFARHGLRSIRAYAASGTVRLVLERAPTVGGEVKGVVEFDSGAAALTTLKAALVCTREMGSWNSGRYRKIPEVMFSEGAVLTVHQEEERQRAPFAFKIMPTDVPSGEAYGSDDSDEPRVYKWELRLTGTHAGGELKRSFVVEVLPAGGAEAPRATRPSAASAAALVAANLLPLALVLAGHGEVGGLVVLYWAENVVIGFYTVLRMLKAARGFGPGKISKTFFFCLHYGGFCFVHGVFVTMLFLSPEQTQAIRAAPPWPGFLFFVQRLWLGADAMGLFSTGALLLPLLALAASHGVSYYTNYLRNGRYLTARAEDSFWRPYPRMVLLHVCIIGGAFYILGRGSSVPLLIALVIGKTLIDLVLHQRSNRP